VTLPIHLRGRHLIVSAVLVTGAAVAGAILVMGEADTPGRGPAAVPSGSQAASTPAAKPTRPLAGRVIVLDAGHQLGNRNFPDEISAPSEAGGFEKHCNTTGTSTNDGYPEATFNFDVTRRAAAELRSLGARVVRTRTANSGALWGPCVDVRGRAGNRIHADLKVSIHADGSWNGGGFHVIAPTLLRGWTDDVYADSRRLALDLRRSMDESGFQRATYTAGGDGLDFRADLATLNLSDIPVAMVECGNMRDDVEAAVMESARGRQGYADAIVAGIRAFLAG
jgi:N-acetylmuramoyl-L-alanine amidase